MVQLFQGLRGDSAHMLRLKIGDAFGKARQTIPAPLHGLEREHFFLVQAAALAHRLFQILHALDLPMLEFAHLQPEAVGTQIHRSQ